MVLACASARAEDSDTEIAKHQYEAGQALFDQGRYEAAIQEFEAARRIKPLAAFNYNIGVCYERLGRWAEAVEAFQRYVDAQPPPRDAEDVRAKIEILKTKVVVQPKPDVKPEQPIVTITQPIALPPKHKNKWRGLAIGLGVGAVAVLVTGGALYGVARADYDSLRSSCAPGCAPSQWAGDPALEKAGLALLAVGGAALAADVVVWIVTERRREARPNALAPTVRAGGLAWAF